jgi:hypothetical protein
MVELRLARDPVNASSNDCRNGDCNLNPSVPQGWPTDIRDPARPDPWIYEQNVRSLALYDGLLHRRSGSSHTLDAQDEVERF